MGDRKTPESGQKSYREGRRSIFWTLFVLSLSIGEAVGLVFPFLTKLALGYDRPLPGIFWLLCILAGFLVGALSFLLFKIVISHQLGKISRGMEDINEQMKKALYEEETPGLVPRLDLVSADKVGELVHAFNEMSQGIAERLTLERRLRGIMATLSSSVTLDRVAEVITASLVELSGTEIGAILYGSLTAELHMLSATGVTDKEALPQTLKLEAGRLDEVLDGDQLRILISDWDGKEWADIFVRGGCFSPALVVLVPLVAEKRPVGLLVLGCHRTYLTPKRRKMIEIFRSSVTPYLQNAFLVQRIHEIASVDELSGCLNRRFGMRRLYEEFALAHRAKEEISVLLIDLDHFKTINDTYGHAAGDHVIREVAGLFAENMRAGEVLCRYGGEEFLVVLPGGGSRDAGVLAERLRRAVEEWRVVFGDKELRITISVGAVTWPACNVASAEELVGVADRCLYHSKGRGRNVTSVWGVSGCELMGKVL